MAIKEHFNNLFDPADDKRTLNSWLDGRGRTVLGIVAAVVVVWAIALTVVSG